VGSLKIPIARSSSVYEQPPRSPLDKTKETRFAVDCLVCADPAFHWATHAQFFCFQHPAKWRPVGNAFVSNKTGLLCAQRHPPPDSLFALWPPVLAGGFEYGAELFAGTCL
jgi:hypothetical protein